MRLPTRFPHLEPKWLGLALAAACWLPIAARATTTVRVEWTRDGVVYGAQTLTSTGVSAPTSASPSCGALGCKARITVLAGAAVVTWGAATPVATQTNGYRVDVGQVPPSPQLNTGDMVAVIEATDAAAIANFNCASGCAGGGGGGGGAVTGAAGAFVDCWSVTLGCKTDAPDTTPANTDTLMAFIKGQVSLLNTLNTNLQNGIGTAGSVYSPTGQVVMIGCSDGTVARECLADTSGRIIVVGQGTAGTPAGGVLSIQGVGGGTGVPVSFSALTTGGLSTCSEIVPANTTSVACKASAGTLYDIELGSVSSTPLSNPVVLKMYDAAQGSTTCGSGTPSARYSLTGGSNVQVGSVYGVAYSTAITYCVTAGIADNDTTAPTASLYVLTMHYK